MPLYEYKCHSCGAVFEVRQTFADEPLHTHDSCGGEVERLISVPSLQFKGTGWYVTDYANKSSSNGKNSEQKSEGKNSKDSKGESGSSEASKSSEKTSEAKPAAPASSSTDKKSDKKA
jgi:putative FmdB family regulatory protein